MRREYGLYADVVYLDVDGAEIDRTERGPLTNAVSKEERARSLTGMRRYVSKACSGRVLLGGKLRDYQGTLPGLIEEALLALQQGTPLFLAGGFGGASLEVLRAMEPAVAEWLPVREGVTWEPTREVQDALTQIHFLWASEGRREKQETMLSRTSMRQLAATYRPSEIATLVGQALVRLADMNR